MTRPFIEASRDYPDQRLWIWVGEHSVAFRSCGHFCGYNEEVTRQCCTCASRNLTTCALCQGRDE